MDEVQRSEVLSAREKIDFAAAFILLKSKENTVVSGGVWGGTQVGGQSSSGPWGAGQF